MKDEQFDEKFKDVLKEKTKNCSMSAEKRRAVLDQIHQVNKEEQTMKNISKKKLVIAVAAMCLMASMVVVAAGKVTYYVTSANTENPTYTSFADIKDTKKDLGYSVRAVEQFSNGAKFEKGFINDVDRLDENGNKIDTYSELMLDYKKGSVSTFVNVSQEVGQSEKTPVQSENVNGKTLNYYEDKYLMLPPDTKPSEEDLALEAAGELFISYGSSEVERLTSNTVVWTEGEVQYLILSWDLSGQELIDMAKEIANAGFVE